MSPTPRRRLGDQGERHARRYLEGKGYDFVAANWRCPMGELDLVMRDGAEVVFVEVKLRHGEGMGRAEEGISVAQCRRLLTTAERFLGHAPDLADSIWRVDLIAITLDHTGAVARLTHIVNAVTTG